MEKVVKRLFDLVLALILFIPASLILLCGVIFVKIVSPESLPIFKQERVGYKSKLFTLYKLRSMTNERDENGELLPDEFRLKKWGKVVRKTNMEYSERRNVVYWPSPNSRQGNVSNDRGRTDRTSVYASRNHRLGGCT